jgi:hypothetical protein
MSDLPIAAPVTRLRPYARIGAGVGFALALVLSIVNAIDSQPPVDSLVVNFLFWPILVGVVLGLVLGWFFGLMCRSEIGLLPSLIAWTSFCAVAAVLIPAFLCLLYGWAIGIGASGFPLRGNGPRVTPFGIKAMSNSLDHTLIYVIYLGMPFLALGWIVGCIAALIKWRLHAMAMRAQNSRDQIDG